MSEKEIINDKLDRLMAESSQQLKSMRTLGSSNKSADTLPVTHKQKKISSVEIVISLIVLAFIVTGCLYYKSISDEKARISGSSNITVVAPTEAENAKNYQEAINFIEKADWDKAFDTLGSLASYNYKDSKALYYYSLAEKKYEEDYNGSGITENTLEHLKPVQYALSQINPNYSGLFAKDVNSFRSSIEERKKSLQDQLNTSKKTNKLEDEITPGSRKLFIGMTPNQVEVSMGRPSRINRTVTANTIHEQWCYPGGVYLYIDDGVLSSWQD